MDSLPLDPLEAAVLAVGVVVGVVGWRWLLRKNRRPSQKAFRCARCSKTEPYSARTIEAWRSGKAKLFCRSCHAKWLEMQPVRHGSNASSHSGCLAVFLFVALTPALAVVSFYI